MIGLLKKWRAFRAVSRNVLTMNRRNLKYIYPNNARRDFPVADNKMLTKELLSANGVIVPETYHCYSSFYEMYNLEQDLLSHHEFVIKPAQGSGGGGIVVITQKVEGGWKSAGGKFYTLNDLQKHIADIIFGVYSFGLSDQAIIEARIEQHPDLNTLSSYGLTDIRIILCKNEPVMAMLRVPTAASDGKANLHQGALGVGIDLQTGQGVHATHFGESISVHPDSGVSVIGFTLPFWQETVEVSKKAAKSAPLKYLGVDLALSKDGPLILEMNVRPGIEIQNANMMGMRSLLEQVDADSRLAAQGLER